MVCCCMVSRSVGDLLRLIWSGIPPELRGEEGGGGEDHPSRTHESVSTCMAGTEMSEDGNARIGGG